MSKKTAYLAQCQYLFMMLTMSFLFVLKSKAQGYDIEAAPSGEAGVDSLNQWSFELAGKDKEKSLDFAQIALERAKESFYSEGEARALYNLSNAYMKLSRYSDAISNARESAQLWEQLNSPVDQAAVLNILGVSYGKVGQAKEALDSFTKGIELVADRKQERILPILYNNLGSLYRRLGNYSEAIWMSSQSLKIRQETGDMKGQGSCRLNLSLLYSAIGHWEKARSEAQSSYNIFKDLNSTYNMAKALNNMGNAYRQMDSLNLALKCYLESYDLKQQEGDDVGIAGAWLNLADILQRQEEYEEARNYFNQALALAEKIESQYQMAEAHLGLGDIAFAIGEDQLAVSHYRHADTIAVTIQVPATLKKAKRKLGDIHVKLGNNRLANEYYSDLNIINDTVKENQESTIFMADQLVSERNKAAVKEQETLTLQAEFKNQRTLLWGISITSILLILTVYLIQRNRRQQQRRILAEQENVIIKNDINELLKDQELMSLNRALEAQEGERKRIARDLHDRLGSMLSMVKLHFQHTQDSSKKNSNGEASTQYDTACRLLDEACEEVRSIAHNLVSGVLKNFGLPAALNELTQTLNDSGKMKVELIIIGMEDRLKREAEDAIYRIIQELVANTMRHARADEMTIQLLRKDQNLNLMVEDNGRGFDVNKVNLGDGIGFQNINARLAKLGGELEVDSGLGSGTTFTLNIPLQEHVSDPSYSS